jgi:hypothetical protein
MSDVFCTCNDNRNKTEAKITLPNLVLSWVNVVYLPPIFCCCSGCVTMKRKTTVKDILLMIVTLLAAGNEENDDKYQPG